MRSLLRRRAYIIMRGNKRRRADSPEDIPITPPEPIPDNAILNDAGSPILNDDGEPILND